MPIIGVFVQSFASKLGSEAGLALARKLFGTEDSAGTIVDSILGEMRIVLEEHARRIGHELDRARMEQAIADFRGLHDLIVQYDIEGGSTVLLEIISAQSASVLAHLQQLGSPALNYFASAMMLSLTVFEERAKVFSNRKALDAGAHRLAQAISHVNIVRNQIVDRNNARFSAIGQAAYDNYGGELDFVEYFYSFDEKLISMRIEGGGLYDSFSQQREQHISVERINALDAIAPALEAIPHWRRWLKSNGLSVKSGPGLQLE